MALGVLLAAGAERDLASIHAYVAESDGAAAADRLLRRLLELGRTLAQNPERGSHPKELAALGILEYRQVILRPYRIIYRVLDDAVVITVIADGRRDMQSLLARRLLEG